MAGRQVETSREVTTHTFPQLVSARSGGRPVCSQTRVQSYDKLHNKGLFWMITHLGSGSCALSDFAWIELAFGKSHDATLRGQGGNVPSNWNRCLFPSCVDPPIVRRASKLSRWERKALRSRALPRQQPADVGAGQDGARLKPPWGFYELIYELSPHGRQTVALVEIGSE